MCAQTGDRDVNFLRALLSNATEVIAQRKNRGPQRIVASLD
jgi:hypothetical protein